MFSCNHGAYALGLHLVKINVLEFELNLWPTDQPNGEQFYLKLALGFKHLHVKVDVCAMISHEIDVDTED